MTRTDRRIGFTHAAVALTIALGLAGPARAETWSIVVVPDTQHYTDDADHAAVFAAQMQWIADHVASHNIALVTHVGDIVQHGDRTTEWARARAAMAAIHGLVPYAVAIGDHDYLDEEERDSGAPYYLDEFGPKRYGGLSWYGGSSPDGKSHYQYVWAAGRQLVHLSLEWEVPGHTGARSSSMGWAQAVLDHHPEHPTIITTHSYLWDKPGREGRTNAIEEDDGDGNSGEMIWSELVRNNPQVFMVLGGNFHKGVSEFDPDDPSAPSHDGEFHQVSHNLLGLPVYEMLSNYQDYPNGGDGWIRIIEFEDGGGAGGLDRIRVNTYSTTLGVYQTDGRSQFHFDLSFAERLDAIPSRRGLHRSVFDQCADAYLWKKYPDRN
ncbi:MAG: metallophosphoesterase, partial [Myxococcota bacterium]